MVRNTPIRGIRRKTLGGPGRDLTFRRDAPRCVNYRIKIFNITIGVSGERVLNLHAVAP